MTVQIPLKKKYRSAKKGTYKGGERAAPKKKRNKIGGIKHNALYGEPPKTVLYVDGATGKGVFITTPA
jgi:hypothetical protein